MNNSARTTAFYCAAIALHAAVLFGYQFGSPAFIADEASGLDATEVALVESAEESVAPPEPEPEPIPPEPPTPEQPPEPEPQPEMEEPPPPPPDAIPEPVAEPPKIEQPKPKPKPAPRPVAPKAKPAAQVAMQGSPNGTPGAPAGKPGAGDNGHATWRNKVRPSYPEAARRAKITGSVQIVVSVNALGQPTSVRLSRSSGSPMLDEAALRAVRASSFNPKRIAGIPLPDTITIPFTFRLDQP